MTNEELALAAKNGDNDSLEQLWMQCKRFIGMQAHKWKTKNLGHIVDEDDLKQAGYFAVVSAVEYYDPNKGITFLTFLDKRLLSEFYELAGIRTSKRDAADYSVSIDAPLPGNDDLFLSDTLADPDSEKALEDIIDDFEEQAHNLLEASINAALGADEQKVIRLYYYHQLSIEQIAAVTGMSNQDISAHKKAALSRLRRQSSNPYYKQLRDLYIDRFGFSFAGFDGYSESLKGTGLHSFFNTGMSSVETSALKHMEYEKAQMRRLKTIDNSQLFAYNNKR